VAPPRPEAFTCLDKTVRERVGAAIDELASDPRPAGALPLTGMRGIWRIRVAKDYRVIYAINDPDQVIRIIEVRHRSEAYDR
jgi:mRNA interferase RelE/StbE